MQPVCLFGFSTVFRVDDGGAFRFSPILLRRQALAMQPVCPTGDTAAPRADDFTASHAVPSSVRRRVFCDAISQSHRRFRRFSR